MLLPLTFAAAFVAIHIWRSDLARWLNQFGTRNAESCRRSISPLIAGDGSEPIENARGGLTQRDALADALFPFNHDSEVRDV